MDIFTDPILSPAGTAKHLSIPRSTVYSWLNEQAAGEPLVHSVPRQRRGWPSVPFVAVVEAYVLRSLRDMHLSKRKIAAAAAEVRTAFDTPYGLATNKIATDGIDLFIHHMDDDDLARVGDGQRPIRQVIRDHLRYVVWLNDEEFPSRLVLPQYQGTTVIIDPRFGWGTPVEESTKTPVDAIVGMWRAGESFDTVANDYGLKRGQVEEIIRIAA